jgi:hypothetical protein
MPKNDRPLPLFLSGTIERQEIHFGSTGDGSIQYPRQIGTYIDLLGTLHDPLKGIAALEVSVSEVDGILQDNHSSPGMIYAVKPVVRMNFWADRPAFDRIMAVTAVNRFTHLYVTTNRPRYGRALVINWSLRTAPEPE